MSSEGGGGGYVIRSVHNTGGVGQGTGQNEFRRGWGGGYVIRSVHNTGGVGQGTGQNEFRRGWGGGVCDQECT